MLQRIEDAIGNYCFGVMAVMFDLFDRAHPALAFGIPLLVTGAVKWFLPGWAFVALTVLVWIPAAAAMTSLLVNCWLYIRRHNETNRKSGL